MSWDLDPWERHEVDPSSEDDWAGDDHDEVEELITVAYEHRGLRLNFDTVCSWAPMDFWAARIWAGGETEAKPTVIHAAEEEYAAARKCPICGCTDYFACPGGCGWAGPDLCTSCWKKGHNR